MRRMLIPATSLLILLYFTLPSYGFGWIFHHPHGSHHGSYYGGYSHPAAPPLSLGFQLPGGFGVTTQFDLQEFFHRHQQMQQHQNNANQPQKTPAPIKINQKTITTANNTYKSIIEKDGLLDELNSLQEKINKKVKDNAKLKALLPKSLQDKKENFFEIIELPKVETSSGVSSATEEKGITKTEKGPDGKE